MKKIIIALVVFFATFSVSYAQDKMKAKTKTSAIPATKATPATPATKTTKAVPATPATPATPASELKTKEKAKSPGTKKDGTPDMRLKENKMKVKTTGPVKKDGTADMRYNANKTKAKSK